MIRDPGIRAVIVKSPWLDRYELLVGGHRYRAKGIENGQIVYEESDDGDVIPPFLTLSREELEAIARAILAAERPEDATVDALKDARTTRDRLLSMLEQRGIR